MTSYLLRPPTTWEAPAGTGPLFSRYKLQRGISLLVHGTTVTEVRYPTQDEVDSADAAYIGGHEYAIWDSAAAAVLIDAGYGGNMVPIGYSPTYSGEYETVYEEAY